MKISELKSIVAKETGLTKDQVESVLKATQAQVESVVASGDKVTVLGVIFGSRDVAERAYPNLKNPDAAPTVVPAHRAPSLKASKGLKEAAKG